MSISIYMCKVYFLFVHKGHFEHNTHVISKNIKENYLFLHFTCFFPQLLTVNFCTTLILHLPQWFCSPGYKEVSSVEASKKPFSSCLDIDGSQCITVPMHSHGRYRSWSQLLDFLAGKQKHWKVQKLAPSFACKQEQYFLLTTHFKSQEVSCTAIPELTPEPALDSATDHSDLVLITLVLHIWNVGNLTVKTLVLIIIGYCGSDLEQLGF